MIANDWVRNARDGLNAALQCPDARRARRQGVMGVHGACSIDRIGLAGGDEGR